MGSHTINDLSNGGVVRSGSGAIGGSGAVRVTVAGADSTWLVDDYLTIGNFSPLALNEATLRITGGGSVIVHGTEDQFSSPIAYLFGNAVVLVDGNDSTWESETGAFFYGGGTLAIRHGGHVAMGEQFFIDVDGTLSLLFSDTENLILDVAGTATLDGTIDT